MQIHNKFLKDFLGGLVKWRDPLRRCHLADPALPRVLERGYAAADFGWGKTGLELVWRPV